MKSYNVIITRDVTESVCIQVEADNKETAMSRALSEAEAPTGALLSWNRDDVTNPYTYFGGEIDDIEEPTEDSPLYVATFTPAEQDAEIKRALNTAIECGVLAGFEGLADNIARTAGIKPADPDEGALPGRTGPRFLTVEIDRLSKVADMLEEANANDEDPDAFAARLAAARDPIPVPAAELGEDEPVQGLNFDGQPLKTFKPGDDVVPHTFIATAELEAMRSLILSWGEALIPVATNGWYIVPERLARLAEETRRAVASIEASRK